MPKPKNDGAMLSVRVGAECHQGILDIQKYMALWYAPMYRTKGQAVELAVTLAVDMMKEMSQEELKKLFEQDKAATKESVLGGGHA